MSKSLKTKALNGMLWSSVERFSIIGIQFLLQIVMARLLSPTDYGIIAMLAIFMEVGQTFIDSGFTNALIQKNECSEDDFTTSFIINFGVGLVCFLGLFFLSPIIAEFYNMPILAPISRFMGLIFIFNSLAIVQQAKLTIAIDFKKQSLITFSAIVISGTIGIYMAYAGYGAWALAVQMILNAFLRSLFFWMIAKWLPKGRFNMLAFRELFSFGSKLLISGVLDTTYRNIYLIVIGKIYSSSDLGFYSRAKQFSILPSSVLTGIMQRVSFPVLSSIKNKDEQLRASYRKFLKLSAFLVFPLMTILVIIADPLVRFLLTDKWENSIVLLQILCLSMMWYPIHAINLNLLQVKGRSDLFLKLEVIKKLLGIIILMATIPLGLVWMCWGQVLSSLLALYINTHYTGKLISLGFMRQIKDLLQILLGCMIMLVIVALFQSVVTISGSLLKIVVYVFLSVVTFLTYSYSVKLDELYEVFNLIKNKIHK